MRLSKRLGQHFLMDEKVLRREIEYAQLSRKDIVLEIGAGDGRLTLLLAEKAGKVIAVEKDKRLVELLRKKIKDKNIDNVEIISADALSIDFPKFNKIVSNLPYGISSPITFKFFEYFPWDLAILSYQKEFAERFFAKPGKRNYSRLTVAINYYCEPQMLETVAKEKFFPKPKVDSVIVRLKPKEKPFETDAQFWFIVEKLFQHKKKLIRSAMKAAKFDEKIIQNVSADLLKKRVFCCTLQDFHRIYLYLKNQG